MLHGQQYEAVAKQTFVAKMDLQNQTCCLLIDSKYNYLAASPYSIVRKNAADNFFSLFLVDDDDGVFYLKQMFNLSLMYVRKGSVSLLISRSRTTGMVAFYQNYSCFTRNIIDNFLLKIYNLIYVICLKPKTCVER